MANAEKACSPDLPDIAELASTTPDLSTLLAAVQAMNLTDVLSTPGPIDVFAPTNDAFAALLSDFGITAEQLLAETDLVTRVLQLHVVTDGGGAVCSGDLTGTVPAALAGESLDVTGDTVTSGGSSATIVGAVDAGNGVVYLIDSVLLPTPDGAAPSGELPSAEEVFASLDGDGDGNVTEAELRAAAEERSIVLTEEQVAAFLAADADLDGGVSLDEYLNSVDGSVKGEWIGIVEWFFNG